MALVCARGIAHATLCLPQNVLGIFYYAALELTGGAAAAAEVSEVKIRRHAILVRRLAQALRTCW